MADEINFMDLMIIKRIKPDTVVEKFGGLINSSFFDASNALGTLKLKGLVDFTTYVPGQNAIAVTDMGKALIEEANQKAGIPFDQLDLAILVQLSAGKRVLNDLGNAVSIRQRDLAMHLYKLDQQEYLTTDFRNGSMDIALTEKGFMQAKSGMPKPNIPQQPKVENAQPQAMPSSNQTLQAQPMQQSQKPVQQAPSAAQQKPPIANPATQAQPQAQQQAQPQQNAPDVKQAHPPEDKEITEMQQQLSGQKTRGSKAFAYVSIAIIIILIILIIAAYEGVI